MKDTRRAEAARVALDVADRLADPEKVRRLTVESTGDGVPEHSIWRDLTLSAGHPALAVLYAELSTEDADRWRAPLHTYLAASVAAARSDAADGLFGGRASLAVALRAAHTAGAGYTGALSKVDDAVAARFRRRLDDGFPSALGFADYDVVGGVSGLLHHFLAAPAHHDLAAQATAALAALCLREGERPGWWVTHGPNPMKPGPPGGHGNVGLAHGAAGILAALSRAGLSDVDAPGRDDAIDALAAWILGLRQVDDGGAHWPTHVPGEARATDGRLSWCYGTPGIALGVTAAAGLRGRPDWAASVAAALDDAVAAPAGMADAGLCHGWAGLAHVLWRLDPVRYEHAVDTAIDAVLDAFEPDSPFGFRSASHDGPLDHPGLLEGAAGVALALHRYAHGGDVRTGWDRALMCPQLR